MTLDWKPVEALSWSRGKRAGGRREEPCPTVDPYLVWAEVTGFVDLALTPSSGERWFPVILELQESAATFAQRCIDNNWDWIRVPSIYRFAPDWLEPATFCTATVTRQALEKLDCELKGYVRRLQLGSPIFSETDAESDTRQDAFDTRDHPCMNRMPSTSSGGPLPALVGIIDEGLAFAHERFRELVGGRPASRIEYFWNQNADSNRSGCVRGLGYGTEFRRGDIGRRMASATHGKQIDEDQLYREAGHRTAARRILHGTHVMDLACGEEPGEVTPESPRVICVELPRQTVRDTSGLGLAVHALDAIRYVLDRAACFSRGVRGTESPTHCPVVVNLSYGNIAGPHDGSSMLEAAIDELISLGRGGAGRRNLQVVLPAGNNHLSRCHARFELAAGAEKTLGWRIQPDDATPSFLEIWLSASDRQPAVSIEVTPPGGAGSGLIRKGAIRAGMSGDDAICTVVYLDRVATGNGRMVLVAVAPTGTLHPTRSVAAAGVWRILIRNEAKNQGKSSKGVSTVTVDAWVQRDDTPVGFPRRGRQSRFEDPGYERFDSLGRLKEVDGEDSYIKRSGTINAIATGVGTVVIGGYRESDGAAAPYSASGPGAAGAAYGPSRAGPDAMAISEYSAALHGVLAAGGRSGSRVAMRGTSVAAPRVTRWVAERMSQGILTDRERVQNLAEQLDPDASPIAADGRAPKPPVERGGGGRLPVLDDTASVQEQGVLRPAWRPPRGAPAID
jgi:hypothetical protein